MHLILVGLNHKTADVALREKCNFPLHSLEGSYQLLSNYPSIRGSVILSTCNRVEIYASADEIKQGQEDVEDFISSYHSVPREVLAPVIYKKNCHQAVQHLFKVASGIDSMVIGEYEIQGQVRDAYHKAKTNHATDNYLNKVFQHAINAGKKVRANTEISRGRMSVATMAVEMIKRTFPENKKLNVLLIGAGKVAELTASNLAQINICKLAIANRSLDKANDLAVRFAGTAVNFENRYNAIAMADVTIVSTSSPNHTVLASEMKPLSEFKDISPRLFIDLSVPRNVDPLIGKLNHHFVFTIDDINKNIDINLNKRTGEVSNAEMIVGKVSEDYYEWYYKQKIMPVMHEIKKKLDVLKGRTLSAYKPDLHSMTKQQQLVVRSILDTHSDKLIRIIMKNLKDTTSKEEAFTIVETLKNSFSVNDLKEE